VAFSVVMHIPGPHAGISIAEGRNAQAQRALSQSLSYALTAGSSFR